MSNKRKEEFITTPELEKFKYEVAQEIGIADKRNQSKQFKKK